MSNDTRVTIRRDATEGIEDKRLQMLVAIGCCVDEWARLESGLVRTHSIATKQPIKASYKLFSHLRSFDPLQGMVDDAVKQHLPEKGHQKHWNTLMEYVKELKGDRNYIVHNNIVIHGTGGPPTTPLFWENAEPIIKNVGITLYGGNDKIGPLRTDDVFEIAQDIATATDLLFAFIPHLEHGPPYDDILQQPIVRRRLPRNKRREANPPKQKRQGPSSLA